MMTTPKTRHELTYLPKQLLFQRCSAKRSSLSSLTNSWYTLCDILQLRDLPATKLNRNWRRRCAAQTTRKLPVCKSRSLRIPSERELLLMQGHKKSKNNLNGKKQFHLLAPAWVPLVSHQAQITDQRWKDTELCRGQKILQPQLPKKKSQVMVHQQPARCFQLLNPILFQVLENPNLHSIFLQWMWKTFIPWSKEKLASRWMRPLIKRKNPLGPTS